MRAFVAVFVAVLCGACGSPDLSDALDAGVLDGGSLAGCQPSCGDAGSSDASVTIDARDAGVSHSEPDSGTVIVDADAGSPDAGRADAGTTSPDAGMPSSSCHLTMCLTGAVNQTSSSNNDFEALCQRLNTQGHGVLKDCETGACYWSYDSFPDLDANRVYPPLFNALDVNHDLKVDAAEGQCDISLIGFSWGGINAGRVATKLAQDTRVATSVRIRRLILLDAYQPGASGVSVSPRVDTAYAFRHSVAPALDCSRGVLLGPYLGARPQCASTQSCFDYDFSVSPTRVYATPSGTVTGGDVDHCGVPDAASLFVETLMAGGSLSNPPPVVPVTP